MSAQGSPRGSILPVAPTCVSLVGMDRSDVAQLRHRMGTIREVRRSLEGDYDLREHHSGNAMMWYLKHVSNPLPFSGLDLVQTKDEIQVLHPTQEGMASFGLRILVKEPMRPMGRESAEEMLDTILDTFESVLSLPDGGLDGSPDAVRTAAVRTAGIIGALHAANGLGYAGTCTYRPRTPFREASVVRDRASGGRAFLRKAASMALFADDPVCVSVSRSGGWYEIKGVPGDCIVKTPMPDPVEALRILSASGLAEMVGDALTPGKTVR